MPTKARRNQEKAKALQRLPELPEHLKQAIATGEIVNSIPPPTPAERLKGGLRIADEIEGKWVTAPSIGQGGAARTSARKKRIADLMAKYPDKWGRRGKASWIANREKLDPRTVQKYFKENK